MKLKRFMFLLIGMLLLTAPAFAQGSKVVTIIYDEEPDNLNTMYSSMFFQNITDELYLPGAWSYDKELNLVPELATEIPSVENGGFNADGSVMTIHLRQDANWSDGEPITAQDFVFTYDMIMAPTNTVATRSPYDSNVVRVEAPDDYTVVTTFTGPYAPWAANLWGYVIPKHVLQPVFDTEHTIDNADWNTAPTVSGGPFVFTQWEAGQFILFTRNDTYFGGTPLLDNVLIRFGDSSALTASLASGDADLATFIPLSDAQTLTAGGNLSLELVPSGYDEGWYFNLRPGLGNPALQDVRVRQALAMGFNRDQINIDLNAGLLTTPSSFWSTTGNYANPDIQPYPFDPDGARDLLTQAGWIDDDGDEANVASDPSYIPTPRVAQGVAGVDDGTTLELRYVTNQRQIRMDTQAVAQQQLGQVGVTLDLVNVPSDLFFGGVADQGTMSVGDFDITEFSNNTAFPDPDTVAFICSEIPTDTEDGANSSGVCLPELDALFAQQAQTVDPAARLQLIYQIDQIMHDQAVWIGIWTDPDVWVYNNRVLGLTLNGPNPFYGAEKWDVQ